MRNEKGFSGIEILVVVAVVLLVPVVLKANPFDRSADPANRRTASAISGRDVVEITNAVAASEKPVTVRVDRSVEASSEVTDPKLTLSQKFGRFVSGMSTWIFLLGGAAILLIPGFGAALAWRARNAWKSAFKNTVAGVRKVPDEYTIPCPHCAKAVVIDPYAIVTTEIEKKQDKRDGVLVDRVKAELH